MTESEKSGTFVVRNADDASAVLADVTDAQVHTLSSNPGVAEGEIVEATISPDPPMNVTYSVVDVTERKTIPVEESEEPPTTQERDLAADQPEGELTTRERAGIGEIHVLTVPEGETENAVADVLDDEATVERAARLDVNRVEIRSEPGVVAVRYLP
ncbi:DUF5812 family protein [Halocalculus aciditolerans]|uniref:Uncharacterized protein n=1 Tax=Halocalculus aciditolerans TaxID=1383812 RepID=A0A830EZJ9_9EURY|nr:DUF5812 family protein [Halocalculus aciditolerans]GGL47829.1 hypothetical protein GCM10009039_02590 [Halocalculus aciditolerans]